MLEKHDNQASMAFRAMRERLISMEEKEKEDYYRQAMQKAKNIAAILKEKYGAKQVYLYGSLAWGTFDRCSDIDLYLVGFTGDYWRAYSEAEAMASPVEVSLACEENCFDSLKEKIWAKGVLL